MAHHRSTPQSVLDAPRRTITVAVAHEGATRQERRHGLGLTMKPSGRMLYLATRNVPHVRTTPRRGKKVRRGPKAA